MKKILLLTAIVFSLSAAPALAATLHVAPIAAGLGDCSTVGNACTITTALGAANPGDTIVLGAGSYAAFGEIDITLDYLTLRGPNYTLEGNDGGRGAEAIFDGAGSEYIFGIAANNVTIEGIRIDASANETVWAGIRIMPGGFDRWAIRNNVILGINDTAQAPGEGIPNHSFGIHGVAQTSNGSDTMTGGLITGNYIHTLGKSTALTGANVSSGVGVYLEGVAGEDADCNYIDQFTCGVWVYDNEFEDLFTGQRQTLQGITTPGGMEYSYGVFIAQDPYNTSPNNGAWVGGNADLAPAADDNIYNEDDVLAGAATKLAVGVRIGIGGSTVNENNVSFNDEVTTLVINEGRKATISELILASFFKTLYPRVFGEGTDVYTEVEADALYLSDATATIVEVQDAGGDDVELIVRPGGESASYKISLDNNGDFNLRFGARLLFDGPLRDGPVNGVLSVDLRGTEGDDLLTVDFNNGNPLPPNFTWFNRDTGDTGGFDALTLRGDEQLDYMTIVMTDFQPNPFSGWIYFEPQAPTGNEAPMISGADTRQLVFEGLEPIDDLLIVNTKYSVVLPDDIDHEVNVINGPFRYGFDTFQINGGSDKTFEEINFANKKNVHIYGADDNGSGDGNDIFTVFTDDGDAPNLLLNLYLWGGSDFAAGPLTVLDDATDDYFVVRPSADFPVYIDGGEFDNGDYLFLDCAATNNDCQPGLLTADLMAPVAVDGDTDGSITGFEPVYYANIESTADALTNDIVIKKELVGFAAQGAHPGDDLEYRVTLYNRSGGNLNLAAGDSLWVTDVIDHRLSLIEQSVVTEAGTVDVTDNRAMLWLLEGFTFADQDSISMTYTAIVNTLITTDDITNYASILNPDAEDEQNLSVFVGAGAYYEHYAHTDLDVLDVFGFPVAAAIQASLFYETEAGPRYMVGLYAGAKDPTQGNIGAMLCRVPDTNQQVGWDGGLGNLWFSCGEGLPAKDGLFSPLVMTDLFQDSAGRIWLTSWGFDGLYYSDDGGQTWQSALADLSGGQGGAPDGIPDGFAQIYSITEDILGTLFISANNGDMYRSFDRGVTWQKAKQLPMGSADTAYSLEADPTIAGRLYAGTFGDSLYVTTDFAETWDRPELDGLGSGYIYDIEFDPLSGNLFVGTAQGIYYSADEGDSWSGLNSAFPEPTHPPEIRTLAFDANGAFFASTWGQGVWFSPQWQASSLDQFALKAGNILQVNVANGFVHVLTDTGATFRFAYEGGTSQSVDTEEFTAELPQGYSLDQNYPNPFNPTTSIAFSLPQTAQINLTVYDVLGRRVATLVNGQLAAGQHTVQFEASHLPSGMYLYRLSTPTGSITQKMMLLK